MTSEKYQPKLDWKPDRYADHIYQAWVDGKQAAAILKTTKAGNVPIWAWSGCYAGTFGRSYPKDTPDRGEEKTARLAVQRAEEFFEAVMKEPINVSTGTPREKGYDGPYNKRRRP